MRNLEAELNEWDGEWPAGWRPRDGETLIGTIRRYSTGQSAYGPVRTAIVERGDGSRVSVWLSSTVLLALFQQEKPKVGERVGIKCLGKHPEKGYRRWSLIVDRPNTEPDFSPLGGEANAEPERPADRSVTPYAAATMGAPLRSPDRCPRDPDPDDPFADE